MGAKIRPLVERNPSRSGGPDILRGRTSAAEMTGRIVRSPLGAAFKRLTSVDGSVAGSARRWVGNTCKRVVATSLALTHAALANDGSLGEQALPVGAAVLALGVGSVIAVGVGVVRYQAKQTILASLTYDKLSQITDRDALQEICDNAVFELGSFRFPFHLKSGELAEITDVFMRLNHPPLLWKLFDSVDLLPKPVAQRLAQRLLFNFINYNSDLPSDRFKLEAILSETTTQPRNVTRYVIAANKIRKEEVIAELKEQASAEGFSVYEGPHAQLNFEYLSQYEFMTYVEETDTRQTNFIENKGMETQAILKKFKLVKAEFVDFRWAESLEYPGRPNLVTLRTEDGNTFEIPVVQSRDRFDELSPPVFMR